MTHVLAPLISLIELTGRSALLRYLLPALVAALVALPGLTGMPVTDRDEARFAQASKQMLQSGDWIDIRFQDQPRWKKPAGIYWLQALSAERLGGADAPIWAYRLPSAAALILASIAMVWAGLPMLGGRGAALAGMMLPVTVLAAVEGHIAKTDAALMLTSVLVLGALIRLVLTSTGALASRLVLWLGLAASILLKGPIVPAIVLLALLGMGLIGRDWRWARRLGALWGVPLMLICVLPWLIAIWIVSDGAFFAESVGKDLLGKVAQGQENHGGPPGLYLLIVWGTFWPWAALLPLAAGWFWAERRAGWLIFLAAWILPFWLVLEAVPTKLPHYVLPLYPALILALGAWLTAAPPVGSTPVRRSLERLSAVLTALPAVLLAGAVISLPLIVEDRLVEGAAILGLLGGLLAIVAARAAIGRDHIRQVAASLLAALCLYPAAFAFALPAMETAFASPRLARMAEPWRSCASEPLVSVGYREPSLIFLTETGTALPSVARAAEKFATDPGMLLLLEERVRARFESALPRQRPRMVERARIRYFNYNRGKYATGILFTRDDPRWDACDPNAQPEAQPQAEETGTPAPETVSPDR